MKNEHPFDSYFKSKLQNHKTAVPEGLWEKIVAGKETKKPPAIWWKDNMLVMTLLCAVLLSVTYLFTNKTLNPLENIVANNSTLQPNTETPGNKVATQKLATESNNLENNIIVADHQAQPENLVSVNEINEAGNENAVAGSSLKQYHPSSYIKNNAFLFKKKDGDKKDDAANTAVSDDAFATNSSLIISNDALLPLTPHTQEKTVSILSINLSPKDLKALSTVNKNILGLGCPNGFPSTWYIEAYGSADINMKSIYAKDVNSTYINKLDSTTRMSGGFTFGVRVSKSINEHFLLKTGLQYSQINERFKTKTDSILTITTVVTTRTIVRGGGQSDTTVRDTSTLQQIGYKTGYVNNRYKSIEIPVIASYETGNDNWRIALNGGVIVNLTSSYTGQTFDTSYGIVPLSAKQANGFYKSNVNLSLYAGVSLLKRIGNGLDAFAEPYFRYSLSNAATSGAGYSQRFNSAGLSLGIRYKLNRKSSSTRD